MSSLAQDFETLRQDLTSAPMRISAYHDLPFAILAYHPYEEYECRKLIRLLSISLKQNNQRKVMFISLAELMWKAVRETEGLEAIIAEEKQRGFERVQETVHTLLDDRDFLPLTDQIEARLKDLDPARDVVFLVRAAAFAPAIYRCSSLLDQLHGRTLVPVVLFYPGRSDGRSDLRFMNIPEHAGLGTYNYRVKIYGGK